MYPPKSPSSPCSLVGNQHDFNPFSAANFTRKPFLKLVEPFSGYCLAIKSQKIPQCHLQVKHFMSFYSKCKRITSKVWACRAESRVLRPILFAFSPAPFVLLFLPCFLLLGIQYMQVHFVGKSFLGEAFSIIHKAQDQMEENAGGQQNIVRSSSKLWSQVYMVFCLFSVLILAFF